MAIQKAKWDLPKGVLAYLTTKEDGYSLAPYHNNNLAFHVGDDDNAVHKNRLSLQASLPTGSIIEWVNQTHSTNVVTIDYTEDRNADAMITRLPNTYLAIMTADCLPVLLCNLKGQEVAAIHAGWRGLLNGIIQNTVRDMESNACELIAYIGPAICCDCFEVGNEVREEFCNKFDFAEQAFIPKGSKWLANLSLLAELVLNSVGILSVTQSQLCTYELNETFFSYRRHNPTGRMATLIGFQSL